jgi:hypothetical protein
LALKKHNSKSKCFEMPACWEWCRTVLDVGKVRMGWLRRAIGLIFATAVAGLGGADFILLARFVWMAVVTVCAFPVIVVGLIGEIARVRALLWYASATGFVAGSSPWLIRAALHLPRAAGYNFEELRFALVFFLGGLISGSVYWLLAGRDAGGRASI